MSNHDELAALLDAGATYSIDPVAYPAEALADALDKYRAIIGEGSSGRGDGNPLSPATLSYVTKPVMQWRVPDALARTWRVTLGVPEIVAPYAFLSVRANIPLGLPTDYTQIKSVVVQWPIYAKLTWGVGGATKTAIVDWPRGATVELHGSMVTVEALIPPITDAANNLLDVNVSAQIAPRTAGDAGAWRPTYSQRFSLTNAVDQYGVMPVPRYARAVTALPANGIAITNALSVEFYQQATAVPPYGVGLIARGTWLQATAGVGLFGTKVPIPPQAQHAVFAWPNAASAHSFLAVFDLDLG